MMKSRQHQHKGKPHTQEKSQGAAISAEDAIIIIRGINIYVERIVLIHDSILEVLLDFPPWISKKRGHKCKYFG
jgi:hypothetical protein